MAEMYGFQIKTKSNAGPKIKYCSGWFDSEQHAIGFANSLNLVLANNAKSTCSERLVRVQEGAYELPEGYIMSDEVWPMWLLDSKENGKSVARGVMTIPCVDPEMVEELAGILIDSGICIVDGDGVEHLVTDATLLKMTYYKV